MNISTTARLLREEDLKIEKLMFRQKVSDHEIDKEDNLSKIESGKFKDMMSVIGKETMVDMAKAGPEQ